MIGQMPTSAAFPSTRSCRAQSRHVLAAALLLATPALAEPQVYRLTPAQREAAIEQGAERPESAALLPEPRLLADPESHLPAGSLYADDETASDRRPHGEVGMVAGTGGTIGVFGTTTVPLGGDSFASFSFDVGQGRGFYGPYGGYGGFDGFGPYPGYIGPGFPLGLVPARAAARRPAETGQASASYQRRPLGKSTAA